MSESDQPELTQRDQREPVGAPSLPSIGWRIQRPRLTTLLRHRFDHRLTVVAAPAGFGKTNVLALSIENNLLDPRGTDIWLPVGEREGDPVVLFTTMSRALGLDGNASWRDALDQVVEAVWSRSPDDVALVIDDAHLVTATAEGADALALLLERLPRNGHLVLGTRDRTGVRYARLEADREVLVIDESVLSFDADELDELRHTVTTPEGDVDDLPSWPALAALQLRSGVASGFDYIWQEILATLPADRVEQLRAVASLPDFDDDIVAAVTEGAVTSARDLMEGLAGVAWAADRGRLHSLVRDAILATTSLDVRRRAASRAGELEFERRRHRRAVTLFAAAGSADRALAVALEFAHLPTLMTAVDDHAIIHAALVEVAPDHPLTEYYATSWYWDQQEADAGDRFHAVAERARVEGVHDVETIALWRALQAYRLDRRVVADSTTERMYELAETVPFARGAVALIDSYALQLEGDTEASLRAIDDLSGMGRYNIIVNHAQRCGDLGWPELVRNDHGPSELTSLFHAQAIWLRGDVSPEDALALGQPAVGNTRRRGVIHQTVSILGVMSLVALAAGELERARVWADEASELAGRSFGASVEAFALMAQAAIASLEQSDEAAGAIIAEAFADMAPDPCPDRSHLYVLPLIYLTAPDHRSVLDRVSLGPAHSAALVAARALVALRDGDPGPATELNWTAANGLRAHVQPHHLAELAVAASAGGSADAEALVATLPFLERVWERLASHPVPEVAARAEQELDTLPHRAIHPLRVHALGPFDIDLGPDQAVSDDWSRRERVRRLLAFLVEHRRVTRGQLRVALWPELDDKKADGNLRVNLSHLQKVLEPDRPARAGTWFIETSGEHVELTDRAWIDADEFEAAVRTARLTDQEGSPAAALVQYEVAVELFRGDYLVDYEVEEWGALERIRLRSMATSSMCRIGELQLAKGEPELAGEWAVRAQRLDALLERAGRLLIKSFMAVDERSAAAATAQTLLDRLNRAGLPPDADTTRLLATVGVTAA
ncbi:MAG: BTAD domain-containing putative transcriptional regulator [Acidimicrobiales bacterium]